MTIAALHRTALVALVAAGLLAGCGGDDEGRDAAQAPTTATAATTPSTTAPTTTGPSATTRTAVAYLLRDEKVAPVARKVPVTKAVAAAALRALLEGPTDAERAAGLSSAVPDGTELRDVAIDDEGLATVDLSSEFASGGGSASMSARVAQVVYTLTSFPTVQRVAFRIDGEPVKAIGGEGVVVDPAVDRADFEDQTPQILVETPLPGDTVGSTLEARGTANTFEATFIIEVLGGEGRQLAKQVVTATSGSGTRGTFDVRVPLAERGSGPIELYAYEASAEDGRPLHEIRIPLLGG